MNTRLFSAVIAIAFGAVNLFAAADLLDIRINQNATATDISGRGMNVEKHGVGAYFNPAYNCYVANFRADFGGSPSTYYAVNYQNDNTFRNGLADGHSIELLVCSNVGANGKESKPFASHQGGGTGVLVGSDGKIAFLPHVNGGWKWAKSDLNLEAHRYYHIVGVWDKGAGRAYIYIDGVKRGETEASGNFGFATGNPLLFIVGGDYNGSGGAEAAWNGDVVFARVYNRPLGSGDATNLYNAISHNTTTSLVSGTGFMDENVPVKPGSEFLVYGNGYKSGDQIIMCAVGESGKTYTMNVRVFQNRAAQITLPGDLEGRRYKFFLKRGSQYQDLGDYQFKITNSALPNGALSIAHRGWHQYGKSCDENSRASLRNALAAGFYGCETDVWITTDGRVMIHHNGVNGSGQRIDSSTYSQVKDWSIGSEKIPTLNDYLNIMRDEYPNSPTKLIIEIKSHNNYENSRRCTQATIDLVNSYGMQHRVEYIAFDYNVCKYIHQQLPNAKIAYLADKEANLKSPSTVKADGLTGIDYNGLINNHKDWYTEARNIGITVNVWTINDFNDQLNYNALGADYITSNNPMPAHLMGDYYYVNRASVLLPLKESWHVRQSASTDLNRGYDAKLIRNMCYFNGRLFCVYEHKRILVLDAKTGDYVGELSTDGISGGVLTLCDVKELGGKIIACNLATTATGASLKVYCWNTLDANPELILETTNFGGAARVGDCIGVDGNWNSGRICFVNDDNSTASRILVYSVSNGKVSATPNVINVTKDGKYLAVGTSARVRPDANGFWVNGKSIPATRLNTSGQYQMDCNLSCNWGNDVNSIHYSGRDFAFIPTFYNNNGNYTNGYAAMLDVTNGWSGAPQIGYLPNGGLGSNANTNTTTSVCVETDSETYALMWILSTNQGISCFAAGDVPKDNAKPIGKTPNLYVLGTVNDNDWQGSAKTGLAAHQYADGKYFATIVSAASHNSFAFTESQGSWSEAAANRWTSVAEPINAVDGQSYAISYQPYSGNRFDIPVGKHYVDIDIKAGTMSVSNRPNVFYIAIDNGKGGGQKYLTNDSTRAVIKCADGKYRGKSIYFPSADGKDGVSYFSVSTIIAPGEENWSIHEYDRWGTNRSDGREALANGTKGSFGGNKSDVCYNIAYGYYDVEIDIDAQSITLTKAYPKNIYVGGQIYGHESWSVEKDLVKAYNAGNGKYYATVVSSGADFQRFAFIDSPSNYAIRYSSGVEREPLTWGNVKNIVGQRNDQTDGCFALSKGTYYVELDLAANKMTVSDKPYMFFIYYDEAMMGNQSWCTGSARYVVAKTTDSGIYEAKLVSLPCPADKERARFTFSTVLGNGNEDWNTIKYDRWGVEATQQLKSGEEAGFARCIDGVFEIEPETYRVKINLNTGKVCLTKDSSGVDNIVNIDNIGQIAFGGVGVINILVEKADVYTIGGTLVAHDAEYVTGLQSGIYVVRTADAVQKVIVK